MRVRAVLPILLVLALTGIAGCFGPKSSPVDVILANPLLEAQPGRGGDLVVIASSTLAFKQTLDVHAERLPKNWSLEPEKTTLELQGQKRVVFLVHVAPSTNTTYGLHEFDLLIGDSRATVYVDLRDLPSPAGAPQGYLTAFAANGTATATTDPAIRDHAQLKRDFPDADLRFAPGPLPDDPKLAGARVGETIAWRAGDDVRLARVTG